MTDLPLNIRWRLLLGKEAEEELELPIDQSQGDGGESNEGLGGSPNESNNSSSSKELSKSRGEKPNQGTEDLPMEGDLNSPNSDLSDPKNWKEIDEILDFTFGKETENFSQTPDQEGLEPGGGFSNKKRQKPYLNLPDWLGRLKNYFPPKAVGVIQKELFENRGFKQLITEPEVMKNLIPTLEMASIILQYKDAIPETARQIARKIIRDVVEELEKKIKLELEKTLFNRPKRTETSLVGAQKNLNWRRTLKANLRNYLPAYNTIIPERLYFYGSSDKALKQWQIIILLDQSGSMGGSIVSSTVIAAVFSSLNKMKVSLLLFSDSVVDVTTHLSDPVEILFSLQLGGGTRIRDAVLKGIEKVENPKKTLFILVSDLYDDYPDYSPPLIRLHQQGAKVMVLTAVEDTGGKAHYDAGAALSFSLKGIFCSPASPHFLIKEIDNYFQKEIK